MVVPFLADKNQRVLYGERKRNARHQPYCATIDHQSLQHTKVDEAKVTIFGSPKVLVFDDS